MHVSQKTLAIFEFKVAAALEVSVGGVLNNLAAAPAASVVFGPSARKGGPSRNDGVERDGLFDEALRDELLFCKPCALETRGSCLEATSCSVCCCTFPGLNGGNPPNFPGDLTGGVLPTIKLRHFAAARSPPHT